MARESNKNPIDDVVCTCSSDGSLPITMPGIGMECIGTREEGKNTICTWKEAVIELMRGPSLPEKDRGRWKLAVRNLLRVRSLEKNESVPNESCKE
jgi:hypothetical protein